ncbi:hypothetical protein HY546_00780, partial [archaeon]|nr:hypothetical protein [archaeon]
LKGWVSEKRLVGGIAFLVLRTCEQTIQKIVARKGTVSEKGWNALQQVGREWLVDCECFENERGELEASEISVIAPSLPLPIEFREEIETGGAAKQRWRALEVRNPKLRAALLVRSEIVRAVGEYFARKGFSQVTLPIIIGSGTEGGSELFKVKYYEHEVCLAQSGQLYKQALVPSLGKVWSIAPSFRAEKSHTPKHVTEFWQIEMEAAFYGKEEIMRCEEKLVRHVAEGVRKNCTNELELWSTTIPEFPKRFERLSYERACEEVSIPFGSDIRAEQEHKLCLARNAPFFLTEYPKSEVAFYYKELEGRPELAHRVDLLGYGKGGWELSSGGVREENPQKLRERIKACGLNPESMSWYLEMFEYGFPPHAGFAIGVERLTQTLLGAQNIREVIAFPRTPEVIVP